MTRTHQLLTVFTLSALALLYGLLRLPLPSAELLGNIGDLIGGLAAAYSVFLMYKK